MVIEDRGFYCGGGVPTALDLSLYLVEKSCGHDVAVRSAKALLIETPRAWQAGFAIVPLKTEHSDDAISSAQEWLHQNFHKTFPLDVPAQRVGMSPRNFVRRFKQATGDNPVDLSAEAAGRRSQAPSRERPSHRSGDQRTPSVIKMPPFSERSSSDTPGSLQAHAGGHSGCSG